MPVCGDGTLDPGEECDDGNTIPADRCSATCTTENPDTCPGPAVPLAAGTFVIQDDSSGATNDTGQLPCGGSASGDFVYAVTPMQNGTLTATLDGQFGTKLYARAACPGMEGMNLACSPSQTPAIMTLPVTAGKTIWVIVDGYGGNAQEGAFTLTLDLQ
jgi:cysteine-rich repeat protein